MMDRGPQPMEHDRRLQLAQDIAATLQRHYGDALLALGVYGSLARGTDGPYSDIELHCVLKTAGVETSYEWSAGPWKAEVDVDGADVLLAKAATLEGDWPITHGAFVTVLPLYDPTGFFVRLRAAATQQPAAHFRTVIAEVIIGDIYELIGKLRNARASNHVAPVPLLAVELALWGVCLVGLINRHLYTSASQALDESLALPDRPAGYDALCRCVMAGELTDAARVVGLADAFWVGIEQWAAAQGIILETDLAALLRGKAAG